MARPKSEDAQEQIALITDMIRANKKNLERMRELMNRLETVVGKPGKEVSAGNPSNSATTSSNAQT
jgi:hypothetical protein